MTRHDGSTASASITITYAVCGADDGGASKGKQSGSTIPVKIRVCDVDGNNISSSALQVRAIGLSPAGSMADSGKSNPGNLFRLDGGMYMFNLQTKGLTSGDYTLDYQVGNDPTVYHYSFVIRWSSSLLVRVQRVRAGTTRRASARHPSRVGGRRAQTPWNGTPARSVLASGAWRMKPHIAIVIVLGLAFAIAAGCADSDAPDRTTTPSPTVTASPESTATVAPGATTSATAVVGTGTVTPEPSSTTTVEPSATATPAPTMEPSVVRLRYVLFDRFGRLWYCDPDFYPIARQDEQVLAEERFPEIEADAETFAVILAQLGIAPASEYSRAQQLAVYRDWKMLRALQLEPVSGGYRFEARFTHDERTGLLVEGTVDAKGGVTVIAQTDAGPPMCPICLARGTRIATPDGPIPVEALRAGMPVWTAGLDGQPRRAVLLVVGSTPAPPSHEVVHLELADGRELRVSPAHPLADGRLVGTLRPGDAVDGSIIVSAALEPYAGKATFDLLPTGPTGTYWADGILLTSTLFEP